MIQALILLQSKVDLLSDIEKDILASFGKDLYGKDIFRLWKDFGLNPNVSNLNAQWNTQWNRQESLGNAAQKVKFSIKDFFSKSDQLRSFLRTWSHLLKKSLMENFIFLCSVIIRKVTKSFNANTNYCC